LYTFYLQQMRRLSRRHDSHQVVGALASQVAHFPNCTEPVLARALVRGYESGMIGEGTHETSGYDDRDREVNEELNRSETRQVF
jgi:hypothetical protein